MASAEELASVYDPRAVEPEIRKMWADGEHFHAEPASAAKPYVIVIPPPNVTGALHGGHALNNTLQDVLVRWHRMRGFDTLWMPGTDHAGIATQAVVERTIFEKEKKSRHDLGRDELVRRIWAWKEAYGNRIIEQLKLMGCSCDWDRMRFTLDDVCARAVRETFFRMFRDGLIVRGKRLVNWDTHLQTAVADDEVYHEKVKGHLWHIRYPLVEPSRDREGAVVTHLIVATTRPETMLGDTAVAVHPDDKRWNWLVGKKVMLPLVNREIPVIADPILVSMEFGTGCVKVTPAHDPNDYQCGLRNHLPMINILTPDGHINENGGAYQGMDRYAARKKVVADLKEVAGLLEKVEDHESDIGHSDRSKTPIEPYLSDQWFVRMGDLEPRQAAGIDGLRIHVTGNTVNEQSRDRKGAEGTRVGEWGNGRAGDKETSGQGEGVGIQPLPHGRGSDQVSGSDQVNSRGSDLGEQTHHSGLAQMAIDGICTQEHATVQERKACGKVHFFPERYANTYRDWLTEKRDWCISRQLWWGHRIPVWRLRAECLGGPVGTYINGADDETDIINELRQRGVEACFSPFIHLVCDDSSASRPMAGGRRDEPICLNAEPTEEVQALLRGRGYERDPDVLDTWFSSALWPHSTLGWPADTPEMAKYYPGDVLSTAREIITLWVARMVLTGLYNVGKVPFHSVYIHTVIQDGQGRPFKKTLGNGFDPVDIIEMYGTDALRFTMASLATETQDVRLPVKKVKLEDGRELPTSDRFEVGRNFCNKIWNAARFAFMNLEGVQRKELVPAALPIEDRWMLSRISRAAVEVQEALAKFNFSRAAGLARDFFWDSLCDWYLELVKSRVRENRQADEARQVLAFALDQALRLLHPFIPFITERLWKQLNQQAPRRGIPGLADIDTGRPLVISAYPPVDGWKKLDDPAADAVFGDLQTATRAVREVRSTRNVAPKTTVNVTVKVPAGRVESLRQEAHVIKRLANVGELVIDPNAERAKNAATLVFGDMQIFVLDVIDTAAERKRLEGELANIDKQIIAISGKLANEGFVSRAPANLVQAEREKLAGLQGRRELVVKTLGEL